jgi:acetyl esterase/lipase
MKTFKDIIYKSTGTAPLMLDIEVPEGEGPFPVVMYVHGGGWVSGTKDQFAKQSEAMASEGFAGVRISYRFIAPGLTFEDTVSDLLDAFEFIKKNQQKYHFDINRFAIVGASAGAHLASLAAQKIPECKCFIGFNGIYNLLERGNSNFGDAPEFIGTSDEAKIKASAIFQLKTPPPVTLLFHGTADVTIDYRQSVLFAEAIKARNVKAEVLLFEGESHGFFNYGKAMFEPTLEKLISFMRSQFKPGIDG